MAITINGTGSITGLTAGGLPDGSVTAADIAPGVIPASLSNAEDGSGTDFQFNSGYGSNATAYGCRAWVNFNGEGTVAIRGSGNVSSITDNGTGDYTVNFSNAMSDANYGFALSKGEAVSEPSGYNATVSMIGISAGDIRIKLRYSNSAVGDDDYFCVAIFR